MSERMSEIQDRAQSLLAFIDTGLNYSLPQNLLQFRDAFTFSLVILILLWRPEGLLRGPATGQRT